MNSNNRVQLTGNLGKDPETRTFESGNKKVSFSIATREEYINRSGEKSSDTQWHNVSAWGKVADKIEAECKKGSFVSIDGRLVHRNYTDKNGQKKFFTEVVANDVVLYEKAS